MKKIITAILTISMVLAMTSCSSGRRQVTEVFDHVVDIGTYTEINYDYADEFFRRNFDGWVACTAVAKTLDNGDTVVARNMDLNICDKPACILRTKVPGSYETIGLAFTNNLGVTWDEITTEGIPEDCDLLAPFMATDILNSEGLYIETNMRSGEVWTDGTSKFGCEGTNPDADVRVCSLNLPRYLAENCKTVKEAVAVAKNNLDIYTVNEENFSWNFCFLLADASGDYGLMEIADNKISWLEGQQAQANFYITPEFAKNQEMKSGVGRYDYVMSHIDAAKTEDDMYDLIRGVSYRQIYTLDPEPKFDARSEFVGFNPHWTYDYIMAPENQKEIQEFREWLDKKFRSYSREELEAKNEYWESTFTNIVNCNEKKLFVRFFEDEERTLTLTFDN